MMVWNVFQWVNEGIVFTVPWKSFFSRMEVLPYDSFASRICGELLARCKKQGFVAAYADTQIASIAISNNMILVTHNLKDFLPLAENSLLKVEDWWG